MPWTPTYNLLLSEQLQTNLLAIIGANEAAALAYVNGNVAMPEFKMRDRARRTAMQFPYLVVGINSSFPNEQEDCFEPEHEFIIEIALLDSDPNQLAINIQRYVRAITLLILSATPAALFAGYDVKSEKRWSIGKANYGAFKSEIKQSQYLHLARFPVRIETLER